MAALLYASRLPDAAYEIVLVAANDPAAEGLTLAGAEGVTTFALSLMSTMVPLVAPGWNGSRHMATLPARNLRK